MSTPIVVGGPAASQSVETLNILRMCKTMQAGFGGMSQYLSLRSNLPEHLQLMLWMDKLQMVAMLAQGSLKAQIFEKDDMTTAEKTLVANAHQSIDMGFTQLITVLQQLCDSTYERDQALQRLERKLDAVLEIPDGVVSDKLKASALDHFEELKAKSRLN